MYDPTIGEQETELEFRGFDISNSIWSLSEPQYGLMLGKFNVVDQLNSGSFHGVCRKVGIYVT